MVEFFQRGKLNDVMKFITFAHEMGYANGDQVDEANAKLRDVQIILDGISNKINNR